jgi:hypothetical protein
MVAVAGVTAMLVRVATVSVAAPETVPQVAVIVVVPFATAVANPEVLMVAVAADEEVQVSVVSVAVSPLLYVPVAVNC